MKWAEEMLSRLPTTDFPHAAEWSAALKTTFGSMIAAPHQIVLFWGPDYIALYNEAYAPTIGQKHPDAFGRPARLYWSELWDDLRPLLDQVRHGGEAVFVKDRPFFIERHGRPETVNFDISYSAVPDEAGATAGVLCIVSETTERVRAEQRLKESEARFRNLADNAPVMMWVVDDCGKCTYLNSKWYQFTGQTWRRRRVSAGSTLRIPTTRKRRAGFFSMRWKSARASVWNIAFADMTASIAGRWTRQSLAFPRKAYSWAISVRSSISMNATRWSASSGTAKADFAR